ncbi:unnamed protein product [Bemisia tabaci]|uniref:Small RNA 2'-O-methyltransferase n=1 Tax=Bemisia tabaci TaxID=7038 RepID=A0A9P0AKN9_BEMTA|nr:unnamed protein product [Bemisia tabaci]
MFNMSLYLLHCMLNFVFKSATEFIFRDKRNRKKRGRYEIARSDKFKADYRLDDDNGIVFIPPVFIQRYHVASDVVRQEVALSTKPLKVVDFGCAEISYFEHLRRIDGLEKVLCIDVDEEMLQRYHRRAKPLNYNHLCPREAPFSVDILAGSIAECDPNLLDTDVVICIELIEHLWPHELNAVPWTIFGYTQPKVAVFTTPNVEFNVMFKGLKGFRHDDHKFEWTREEFEDWAENIVLRFPNYEVRFSGIGPGPVGTEHLGCVSQMAVFTRKGSVNEETVSSIDTKTCYKKIESYEYPFFIDTRTEAEKIRDEVAHHRIRLAYLEPYVDQDIPKIELSTLLKFVDRCQSIEELKTILESFGTVIEENENGDLCVVGMDDDSSEEEEGYLTGDADTENAYSDWGTFKANEWPTSPAWDATAVTDADWDAWDEPAPSQNRLSSPNEHISEELKVSAVLETSHMEIVETNSQTLTRQNRDLEEFHHLSDKSLTSDHEKDCAGTKLSELEVSSVPQIDHIEREESNLNNLTGENLSLQISHQINNASDTLQNERNPPEKKCDQLVISPVCEQNCTNKGETKTPLLSQNESQFQKNNELHVSNTLQLEGNSTKTKPPVLLIDLAHGEVELTCDLANGNQANSSTAGSDENMSTSEGVWVISEELKNSKPHRRKYRKYKKRKSFEAGGCENTDSNFSDANFQRKKNTRSKRGSLQGRSSHVPNVSQEQLKSITSELNDKIPYVSTVNSFSSREVKSVDLKNGNERDCKGETSSKSSPPDRSEKNLTTAIDDSVNNRPLRSKPGRGGKRGGKRRPFNTSEMTSFASSTCQPSIDAVKNNKTLNNDSNQMTYNTTTIPAHEIQSTVNYNQPVAYQNKFSRINSNRATKKMRNNTGVLLPKKLNQDCNFSKIGNQNACKNPANGNPFMSTFMKLCDETSDSHGRKSQDCSKSEKNIHVASL